MDKLKLIATEFLLDSYCDAIAVGVLDFKNHTFRSFELLEGDFNPHNEGVYYDIASLSKPLCNSFVHIANKLKDKRLELLLNHKAGLPSWGLLSRSNWKEQILSYEIVESPTLYSDFSAIRYMLEVETLLGKSYRDLVFKNFAGGIYHWMNLPKDKLCLQNGYYNKKPNIGEVHDPNAHNIKAFLPHAGLFTSIESLCRAIIEFDRNHDLISLMNIESSDRFLYGFDTVSNPNDTLAGAGCSNKTFGHLGFTGTSFWIDPTRKIGHVILTNATKYYWFDRGAVNQLRRDIGTFIWNNDI